ncbi:hypothetical protein DDE83_006073 [Stemphylium lycopersici]|uniref:Uncharacterized protein n=1 Tax=Stemphylium lycopersici TaxID=183478 RepID=A0A364N046_STELY|nr:hypothetical protein DDE83_006073 [Stemphylium lycopersici]
MTNPRSDRSSPPATPPVRTTGLFWPDFQHEGKTEELPNISKAADTSMSSLQQTIARLREERLRFTKRIPADLNNKVCCPRDRGAVLDVYTEAQGKISPQNHEQIYEEANIKIRTILGINKVWPNDPVFTKMFLRPIEPLYAKPRIEFRNDKYGHRAAMRIQEWRKDGWPGRFPENAVKEERDRKGKFQRWYDEDWTDETSEAWLITEGLHYNPPHRLQTSTMTWNTIMSPKKDTEELKLVDNAPVIETEVTNTDNHQITESYSSDPNTPPLIDTKELTEHEGHILQESIDRSGNSVFVRRSGRNVGKKSQGSIQEPENPAESRRYATIDNQLKDGSSDSQQTKDTDSTPSDGSEGSGSDREKLPSGFTNRMLPSHKKLQKDIVPSEHESDGSSEDASGTIKTPESASDDDENAAEIRTNEPVPKRTTVKNVNNREPAKESFIDDEFDSEAAKAAERVRQREFLVDLERERGYVPPEETEQDSALRTSLEKDIYNNEFNNAHILMQLDEDQAPDNPNDVPQLDEDLPSSVSHFTSSDERSEAESLHLDTIGFMPSADNDYQFVDDSPFGGRAEELNDLLKPPSRAKNFPTDLAGQKANLCKTYRFLGSLPKPGHVRDMVARMEQGMKKLQKQVDKDMQEEAQSKEESTRNTMRS